MGTVGRNGTQEDYDTMASKSIEPIARGRKITHKKKEVSKILKWDHNIYNASHHIMLIIVNTKHMWVDGENDSQVVQRTMEQK